MIISKRTKALFSLLVFSAVTTASELGEEQDKLARYEQIYENHSEDLADLDDQLVGSRYKIEEAQTEVKVAQAELDSAAKTLLQAQSDAKQTPGADTERALKLAMHAHDMAERGLRTRSKRLERLQGNQQALEAQLTAQKALVQQHQQRVAAQKLEVAETAQKLEAAAARKAQQQARTVPVSAAPVAAMAAAPAVAIAATAPAAAVPVQVLAAPVTAPAPVATRTTAPAVHSQSAPVGSVATPDLDQEELAYVRKEMERLRELTVGARLNDNTFKNLYLEVGGKPDIEFVHVGRDQYRAEAVVSAGKQSFVVRKKSYRRTIPEADEGAVYVFIYDAKRLTRPRLVSFRKSLLDHL